MAEPVPLDVTIRFARDNELEALECFIEPFVTQGRVLPRTREELFDLLPRGFVATAGEEIVGFAALEVYSRKLAEVRSLVVSEKVRGQGIGRKLVTACVDLARHLQIYEVLAITSEENFFRSCGFDFTLPGEKKALFYQTRETH